MPQIDNSYVIPYITCPLTKEIMVEPVIASDGYSYEKKALEEYLKTNQCSPRYSNLRIQKDCITFNWQLKQVIDAYHSGERVESHYYCAINKLIMLTPCLTSDGHSYEKDAIYLWLIKNNTSPCTGKVLENKTLVLNHNLRDCIWKYLKQNPSVFANDEVYFPEGGIEHDLNMEFQHVIRAWYIKNNINCLTGKASNKHQAEFNEIFKTLIYSCPDFFSKNYVKLAPDSFKDLEPLIAEWKLKIQPLSCFYPLKEINPQVDVWLMKKLFQAIRENNSFKVVTLIKLVSNLTLTLEKENYTVFHLMTEIFSSRSRGYDHQHEIFNTIVNALGADIISNLKKPQNWRSEYLYDQIRLAAEREDDEKVLFFIRLGADINEAWSRIFKSKYSTENDEIQKDLRFLELFLQNGLDIKSNKEIKSDGKFNCEELVFTASNGHKKLVQLLLDQGASPNSHYLDALFNCPALHSAVSHNKIEIVKLLLEYGADMNLSGDCGVALFYIVHNEFNPKIIELLLCMGADINAKDNEGNTLVHNCVRYGKGRDSLNWLNSKGLDFTARNNEGETALHLAIRRGGHYIIDTLDQLLLLYPELIDMQDLKGRTAIDIITQEESNIFNVANKLNCIFKHKELMYKNKIKYLESQLKNAEETIQQHTEKNQSLEEISPSGFWRKRPNNVDQEITEEQVREKRQKP